MKCTKRIRRVHNKRKKNQTYYAECGIDVNRSDVAYETHRVRSAR